MKTEELLRHSSAYGYDVIYKKNKLMTEYEKICLSYFAGKVTFEKAMGQIVNLPRPWTTKEWKKKRAILLKLTCENCGTTEQLQIQHFKHPREFSVIQREIIAELNKDKYDNIELNSVGFTSYLRSFIKTEKACPNCLVKSTKYNKCPKCKCTIEKDFKVEYYRIPGFKNLSINTELDAERIKVVRNFYIEKTSAELRSELWLNHKDVIRKTAFERHYSENIRYLSLVDTKTACKSCSSKEDYVFIKKSELERGIL